MTLNQKRSATEIGASLAECYHSAFSADAFHGYFDSASIAEDQDIDHALAEWHAFGTFSYTFCLWKVYDDQSKVSAVLDVFQLKLLESLHLNEAARKQFLNIVTERQNEYLSRYQEVNDGPSMARFFGRVVSHITGSFSADFDRLGIPQLADSAECEVVPLPHDGNDQNKGIG
jgi:hypothetical protein